MLHLSNYFATAKSSGVTDVNQLKIYHNIDNLITLRECSEVAYQAGLVVSCVSLIFNFDSRVPLVITAVSLFSFIGNTSVANDLLHYMKAQFGPIPGTTTEKDI